MKYNRQAFCDLKDKEKLKIVKEELSVVTHNGVTKDDLLMLLDWTYNRLVKGDLNDVTDINVGSKDGWIPVEERLPEEGKEVLAQFVVRVRHTNGKGGSMATTSRAI